MPKRLLLNASVLGPNPTGLGVYAEHCLSALVNHFDCDVAGSYYHPQLASGKYHRTPENIAIGADGAAMKRLFYSLGSLPTRNCFVYSPTQHGVFNTSNQVITIHDLICIRHPQQHKSQYYFFRYVIPLLLKRCKAIFAISETEKMAVAEFYRYPENRIHVVSPAVDTTIFTPLTKPPGNIESPYLLVVGASYPHKNIAELLDNHRFWSKDYRLKIISCKGPEKERLASLIQEYGLQGRVDFPGYVTQAQLVQLYQECHALIFPSLSEGFGIPPLEAFACGKPVIASDIPVHKEVLEDSAFFITPTQGDTWRQAFSDLQDSEKLVTKLECGKSVIKKYTWEQSANILVKSLLDVEPELSTLLKQSPD